MTRWEGWGGIYKAQSKSRIDWSCVDREKHNVFGLIFIGRQVSEDGFTVRVQ